MKILRTKKFRILVALIGIAFLSIACSGNDDTTDGLINPVTGSTNIGLIDDSRILEAGGGKKSGELNSKIVEAGGGTKITPVKAQEQFEEEKSIEE